MDTRPCIKCGGTERLLFSSWRCDNDICCAHPGPPMSDALPPGLTLAAPSALEVKRAVQAMQDSLDKGVPGTGTLQDIVARHTIEPIETWKVWREERSLDVRLELHAFGLCSYCVLGEQALLSDTEGLGARLVGEMEVLRANLADVLEARNRIQARIARR